MSDGNTHGSPGGAAAAAGALRLAFVDTQVSYYMTQMTIAEAKAGFILAFAVAISGVTADRLDKADLAGVVVGAGLTAIALSLVASVLAVLVIWPRRTGTGSSGNVFSWVNVSRTPWEQQARNLNAATEDQLISNVSEAMTDIAFIIRTKYDAVKRAVCAVLAATILHLTTWGLMNM